MSTGVAEHPITVQQHILREQQRFPGASGEFSWLLSGITLAAKMIEAKVRRAGLNNILGDHGAVNVQGEVQQKLDVYANRVMSDSLAFRDSIAVIASEENEEPTLLQKRSTGARYIVVFDPLDGSSNIDVNVSVGTTFSIIRRSEPVTGDSDVLCAGDEQVAAGYVLYGSSTMLVYTAGNGVHGFTLDPGIGAFLLSHENIRIPEQGPYYSVNESHYDDMPVQYRMYLDGLRRGTFGRQYGSRYIGSMVADFHRTLLKGGVFIYPPTKSHPEGKLRLLYEANPVAYLAEQAGGRATDGQDRILELLPHDIHQRTPLIVGGTFEMAAFDECCRKAATLVCSKSEGACVPDVETSDVET
ncbi:MAG: class 1 fructose-bisphosphatase [Planctomycetaceae bacterium]|nr:class 1 fructose-bisphosphatase [Planctomycetaceae bacterium]